MSAWYKVAAGEIRNVSDGRTAPVEVTIRVNQLTYPAGEAGHSQEVININVRALGEWHMLPDHFDEGQYILTEGGRTLFRLERTHKSWRVICHGCPDPGNTCGCTDRCIHDVQQDAS